MSKFMMIAPQEIGNRIILVRGIHVMLDSDLAKMYQSETKYINRAVKRNPDRFPTDFAFQLDETEWENLKFQSGTSRTHGGRRTLPYVFTEQGVAMLSAVLQTDIAVKVSVQIVQTFVQMRKFLNQNLGLLQRMDGIERKQLETEQKFEQVFQALGSKKAIPNQGVFFDGQVFDAYELASRIIRSALKSIILIDNYIDESTLIHLAKKNKGVRVLLFTKDISKPVQLDVKKANEQYGGFKINIFDKSHDRFLIIDNEEVYHLGASLKDLGKRWFAFSKLDKNSVENILKSILK
jgi:hypothetical protein